MSALTVSAGVLKLGVTYVDPPVNLQAVTPGTAQTGHINVTGTVLAGTVYASSSGSTDKVVSGWATAASGFNFGGDFRTASTSGRGVFGSALSTTGFTYGGDFRSASINGRGLFGWSTATTGYGVGGEFRADGSHSKAVYGWASASNANSYGGYFTNISSDTPSLYSENLETTGAAPGGEFHSRSSSGFGVVGRGGFFGVMAQGGDGGLLAQGTFVGVKCYAEDIGIIGGQASVTGSYGGYFSASSPTGAGVIGVNVATGGVGSQGTDQSTSGAGTGGWFSSGSPSGRGLFAEETSTTGACMGGLLESASESGRGVYGFASSTTGTNYGVYGRTSSPTGYAIYGNGRFAASGTKSFRIDDPLDPEHKYLNHYCSEGPIPLNIYQGHVTTDANGFAWVQMPDYYDEINKDPEYQLTVVDQSDDFVLAKISRPLENRKFQVRTSRPRIYVSWEVKATRNDRFVKTYGAPVETEKPKTEQGLYQSPELYNQPPIRGVNFKGDLISQKAHPVKRPRNL